jgi:hypothetical protein
MGRALSTGLNVFGGSLPVIYAPTLTAQERVRKRNSSASQRSQLDILGSLSGTACPLGVPATAVCSPSRDAVSSPLKPFKAEVLSEYSHAPITGIGDLEAGFCVAEKPGYGLLSMQCLE